MKISIALWVLIGWILAFLALSAMGWGTQLALIGSGNIVILATLAEILEELKKR